MRFYDMELSAILHCPPSWIFVDMPTYIITITQVMKFLSFESDVIVSLYLHIL